MDNRTKAGFRLGIDTAIKEIEAHAVWRDVDGVVFTPIPGYEHVIEKLRQLLASGGTCQSPHQSYQS